MERVFVSYKFRDTDRQVASDVKRLVKSHLLTWQDGEDLGGDPLFPGTSQLVQAADSLIALFLPPVDETSQTWVSAEYDYACDNDKPSIPVELTQPT